MLLAGCLSSFLRGAAGWLAGCLGDIHHVPSTGMKCTHTHAVRHPQCCACLRLRQTAGAVCCLHCRVAALPQLGWEGFHKEVVAFYHGLSTHASSRQVFLSTEPYDLPPPQKRRDFKKVVFK
jgi:hypothetical protein